MRVRALVVALVGLAVGFGAGYLRESSAGPHPAPALAAVSMERELETALGIRDTLERTRVLQDVLLRLGPHNAAGARKVLSESLVTTRDCDLRAIVSAWSVFDPQGAFETAISWTASHKRSVGVSEAAMRWALNSDPLEAREYAASLPGRGGHDAAMTGLVLGWANSGDIAGVTEHLIGHSAGPGRGSLIGIVASTIARRGSVAKALAWSDAIEPEADPTFKEETFRAALTAAMTRDPEQATRWWESQQHEAHAAGSLWLIPSLWLPNDPDAAIEWSRGLPQSDERDRAIQAAIRRFYEIDPGAALRWLATHPLPREFLATLPENAKRDIGRLRRTR